MSDIAAFTHGGATLVAETAGAASAPVYLLIHGIGMGRTIFARLIEHLTGGGPRADGEPESDGPSARTIAIDLPGYGEAPEPARVLTMERTADLVAAYVQSLDEGPVVVVGHSMGAQIAIEMAARHPAVVDRLVLIAPTVDPRERTAAQQMLRLAQDLLIESPRVLWVGAREYVRAGPHLRGKFRAMLVHRPEDVLDRVDAPTLVLRGEYDCVSSRRWCRQIAATLRDARLAEVRGHGHETMIRDAAPAAGIIGQFVRTA